MMRKVNRIVLAFGLVPAIMISFFGTGCSQKKDYNIFVHEILPNGLDLIIKYNPDSRVYAINILGKNRSLLEPNGKEGITDFVNRMLTSGADGMSADEVQNALDDIGAEITANDNPYIPYDDRYTSSAYSFIKFETIDEYAHDGTELLHRIISKPDFPGPEIRQTSQKVMGLLGMKSGSTYQNARDLCYKNLFSGFPFSKPVLGNRASIMQFTRDDLISHHQKFYAPNNMIMAIATNIDPDTVKSWVYETFGKMEKNNGDYPTLPRPSEVQGRIEVNHEMNKEQIYIYMGGLCPGMKSPEAPAIDMAASIISSRMKENLREQQGLAYSVGMGVSFMPEFGWLIASMGTGFENYEVARDGMIAEINKLKSELPTAEELKKAQNSTWGSMLLARASRINQAYYMCKNEFLGVGYNYEDDYISKIRTVTPDDIQRVVKDYFDTENIVIASAGKKTR
ncbi:MAG: insulinase family protein [Candidatus Zixiibacteriota bacterium]|nr:MAG: insulinase family protein [candidate division Zixibacteria bacterium]